MTPELWVNLIGIVVSGFLGGAFVKWVEGRISKSKTEAEIEEILAQRDNAREEEKAQMQDFWHKEFKRLNARIDCQDKIIKELKTNVKGREVTIAELTAENISLKKDQEKLEKKNIQLEARIAYLEKLLKKAGIDPDGGNDGSD